MASQTADTMASKSNLNSSAYRKRPWWKTALSLVRRKPLGALGGMILIIFIIIAIFAPQLAPKSPNSMDSTRLLVVPQAGSLLGTDEFGRDILSRLIWGARISLVVGLMSVSLGTTAGAILGLVGGYYGGKIDFVIQRVMDTMLAFPMLVLALAMVAALGSSMQNVILAIAVVMIPSASRVIRSSVLVIRETTYIEAARAVGVSDWRLIFRHVLPNCLAPFIIMATAGLGSAILSEASLSFLGLGIPPPEPSWGAMLSGTTQRFMYRAPWLAISPGMAISLAVFGFNFLGDALRDILDPRLVKR